MDGGRASLGRVGLEEEEYKFLCLALRCSAGSRTYRGDFATFVGIKST